MSLFKTFVGLLILTNVVIEMVDIIPVWGSKVGEDKIMFIILILIFLPTGAYLFQLGLRKEYKGEKRIKIEISKFFKVYFGKYQDFLKKYIDKKRPPLFLFVLWLIGAYHVLGMVDINSYAYGGTITNWGSIWLIAIFLGIPLGYMIYVIYGLLYHAFVRISGGNKNMLASRNLVLYASIPLFLALIFTRAIETLVYGNKFFIEGPNVTMDIIIVLIIFAALLYSIYLSYVGVRLIQKAKKTRSIIFFLIIPALYFTYLNGSALLLYSDASIATINYNEQAISQMNHGDFDSAAESFERAIENLKKDGDSEALVTAYINLATTYQFKGDLESAKSIYKEALEIMNPDSDAEYHAISGIIAVFDGDMNSAITKFEAALQMDPDNQTANNYLGLMYMGRFDEGKKNLDKALSYNQKAFELNATDSSIVQNLALNYFELEHYNEALPLLQDTMVLMPGNMLTQYIYALTLYHTGSTDESKKLLLELIELNPSLRTEEAVVIINNNQ